MPKTETRRPIPTLSRHEITLRLARGAAALRVQLTLQLLAYYQRPNTQDLREVTPNGDLTGVQIHQISTEADLR
jgi:hypothetical protein